MLKRRGYGITAVKVNENGERDEREQGKLLLWRTEDFNYCLDDGKKNGWDMQKRKRLIQEQLGEKADGVITAFQKAYPDKNIVDLLFIDTIFRTGALEYADLRAGQGCANTYNYSKRILAVYYEQNVTMERFEDFDGERWIMPEE